MKILNIFEFGNLGGPQKRAIILAKELKKYNMDTIFLIPENSYFPETDLRTIKIDLHRLTRDKKHLFSYIYRFPYEVYKIYEIIKEENPDIVYCNGAWQFKGVIAGKLAKKKVVWHLNDTMMPWIIRQNFKAMSSLADGFIIAGQKAKDYWKDLITENKKILVINAPVDVENEYNPKLVQEDTFISKFEGIKIVNISNINPIKGLEYFIKMAFILNKKYNNLTFFIVGRVYSSQKKYFKNLKNLIEQLNLKNLYFYIEAPQINSVLKSADIFVFTSLSEASPLAVWEAMAMELPIVSTNVGDVAQFIEDGVNGFVVPPKDIQALVKYTSILIEKTYLWKSFGRRNRRIAVANFDSKLVSLKIKNFLSSL